MFPQKFIKQLLLEGIDPLKVVILHNMKPSVWTCKYMAVKRLTL